MSNYQEAIDKSLEYFDGDELAANVFVGKYALTDKDGNVNELTPDGMHRRLAREFARIEKVKGYPNPMSEDEIYSYFKHFESIVAQGSPMNAIGNDYAIQSTSNCFVIEPCYDSYGGILKTDQEQVQLMKRRGGVGHDVSNIRPKGLHTNNAAKTTDGIGVFLERFSNSCREVAQGGRRGALMLTISVHHPEVETFINIKKDKTKVTGANISVKLSDEFMNAVKNDGEYEQRFPIDSETPSIRKMVKARDIWNQIILAAWESAEPGLLFWDTALKNTPSDIYKSYGFRSTSTNPCGEIILSNYDSCRLMVMNLYSFVNKPFTKNAKFDFKRFGEHVFVAQRLMDDLIDLELEQVDKILKKIDDDNEPEFVKLAEKSLWLKIKQACEAGRRTGLGITALGDTLAAIGIRYGSDESIQMTEKIYKSLAVNAYRSSIHLAKERGAFSCWNYELEKEHPFVSKIINELDDETQRIYKKYGRRNIAITTTAPTGSVSVLTQTTSGIEPAYKLDYKRRKKINPNDKESRVDFVDALGDKWQEFIVYHKHFKTWMDVTGETDVEKSPYYKATSNDVDWIASVKLQAAAQKWVCHAISKTCNLPNSASKELVAEVYMKAWEEGCKGFTVYRDGCRTGVLVSNEAEKNENEFMEHAAPKRPKILPCDIHQVTIKGESWTILVGKLDNKPYEIFGGLSKFVHIPKKIKTGILVKDKKRANGTGIYNLYISNDEDTTILLNESAKVKPTSDLISAIEKASITIKDIVSVFENPTEGAFTRTLSLAMRHGAPIQYIVEQLQKDDVDSDMYSFSKVIARVLKHYIKEGTKASDKKCENCGAENSVIYKEGCKLCVNCSFSKCG